MKSFMEAASTLFYLKYACKRSRIINILVPTTLGKLNKFRAARARCHCKIKV